MSGPRPGAPGTPAPGFRGGRVPPFAAIREAVRVAADFEKAQSAVAEVFGPVNTAGSEELRTLLDELVRQHVDREEQAARALLVAAGLDPDDRSEGWQARALDALVHPEPLLILAGSAQLARATAIDLGLPSHQGSGLWRHVTSARDLHGRSRVRVCYGHRWHMHPESSELDYCLRAIAASRGPDAVTVVEIPEGRR